MDNGKSLTSWPETDGWYKVVQLIIRETPCFAFVKEGLGGASFHDELLSYTLRKNRLKSETVFTGPEHEVVGMGFARVTSSPEKVIVTFSGQSRGYKISINTDHVEQMKDFSPDNWQLVCG
jgi:hypothetical protein